MLQLGAFYGNGFGVTKDHARAREWYQKAAVAGDTEAMEYLQRCA